jgi:methylated-DNA-[protein]-cysteine S-methyltransferase
MRFCVCNTKLGWIGLAFSKKGLHGATMPQASARAAEEELRRRGADDPIDAAEAGDWPQFLHRYAAGEPVSFSDGLDLEQGTPFQRRVWRTLLEIPQGETRSYRWVAERMGQPGAARAVGQAVRANPLPIVVPCHRVVASDGGLGGYGGGPALKERLLRLEGASRGRG